MQSFQSLPGQKMNQSNFTMLVYGIKFKMTDLVMMKSGVEQSLNKYLGVSAPGQAAPDIKRSFLRFRVNLM